MTDIIKILTGRLLGLGSMHEIDAWLLFLTLFIAMGLLTVFTILCFQIWRLGRMNQKVNKLRMCFTSYKETQLKDQIKKLEKALRWYEREDNR